MPTTLTSSIPGNPHEQKQFWLFQDGFLEIHYIKWLGLGKYPDLFLGLSFQVLNLDTRREVTEEAAYSIT